MNRCCFSAKTRPPSPESATKRRIPVLELLMLAALWAIPWSGSSASLPDVLAYRANDLTTLRQGFVQPPREVGPWVYWISWDNAITAQELLRELEVLVAAGFSGAEMRFVESPWLQDRFKTELSLTNHRPLEFLSPEFLDCLKSLCERARERGFKLGFNLGMGWPPGGTWITPEHQSKCLLFADARISGGQQVKLAVPQKASPAEMVFAWRVSGADRKQVQRDSFTDTTRHLAGDRRSLNWDAPPGDWLVGFFRVGLGGKLDKASGFAADPGSASAMRFHLDHVFSRLDAALSNYYGNTITDIASDSWEYDNRPYWTPGIFDEFQRVNGYDLRKAMHGWLGYGPDLEQIQEDLARAENSLVCTNYFDLTTRYANQRGLQHRPQARGRGLHRDLFDAYARSDIPEVEQEVFPAEAVWVAHVLGKPIVSTEAYTFVSHYNHLLGEFGKSFGSWEANPDLLRRHANLHFANGINRIQMHGFSYSPPGLKLPGWRMYAETHLNDYVIWWPYMHHLNRWITRNQFLLRSGIPMADTLVYPVQPNPPEVGIGSLTNVQPVCAADGVDGLPRGWLKQMAVALRSGYYGCSNLLLLQGLETPAETAQLAELLDAGVTVACLKSLPESWPGFRDGSASTLREKFNQARESGRLLDWRGASWPEALNRLQSARWNPADARLRYQHRQLKDGEAYFLVNDGDATFDGEVSFPQASLAPEVWDAEAGTVSPAPQYRREGERTWVKLAIKPYDSAIVVFSTKPEQLHAIEILGGKARVEADGQLTVVAERSGTIRLRLSEGPVQEQQVTVPQALPIHGPWVLHADKERCHGITASAEIRLEKLVNWRELPAVRDCFGIVRYSTEFELPAGLIEKRTGLTLALGEVCELAQVWVNGKVAGTSWSAPHRLDITTFVRPGKNSLRIEVPNHFAGEFQLSAQLAREFGLAQEEKPAAQKSRPSGLLGPVSVVPYVQWKVQP